MKYLVLLCCVLLLGAGCASSSAPQSSQSYGEANNAPGNVLNLSNRFLPALPGFVVLQTSVEELDISHNLLEGALPSQIGQMKALRVLRANNNRFTGIPAEIGQLDKLEILDFSNNQLTGLPNELGNLSNLKVLDVSGNDISEQDLEVIRNKLPATVEIRQ